jgi:putative alpha-1,2-mannosidase
VADYCDILLMPTAGNVIATNIVNNDPKQGYASAFSHSSEKAAPGYYSVMLEDEKIQVELTASTRVGMHQYTFPATNQANIILDLNHRDQLLEGSYIEIISPTKIQGLRRSSSWAKRSVVVFCH